MIESKFFKVKSISMVLLGCVILAYLFAVPFQRGNDINVYLHASQQLFDQQNIYQNNPFNFYLYSPLFTLLIAPLNLFDFPVARVIWAILNMILLLRLYQIWQHLINGHFPLTNRQQKWWLAALLVLSLGFLNHNMLLGQVTILILWLTIEGLWQIRQQRELLGAVLLALGINIKIIPLITLGYLFLKGKFRAIGYTLVILIISLWIPALLIGFEYNQELLMTWKNVINPQGEKFAFENNDGCHSLNSLLPAYFYDFGAEEAQFGNFKRKIFTISYQQLSIGLQAARLLLVLSVIGVVFYRFRKRKNDDIYFFWEIGYLMLVSYLIFPHQMKYSMLYFVPAGIYVIYYLMLVFEKGLQQHTWEKTTAVVAVSILLILSVSGRDIIGNYMADLLDYYRFYGLACLIYMPILFIFNPYKLNSKLEVSKSAKMSMAL